MLTTSDAGDYCVRVTVNGCESEEGCTTVIINPTPPNPNPSNNGPLCEGEVLNLSTSSVTNATYAWTGPSGYTSSAQNPMIPNVTTSDAGDYCVIITVDGCDSQEECTTVVIDPTPPNPSPTNNGPLCEGDVLNLTTPNVSGATFAWTGPSGYTSSDQNPFIPNVTVSNAGDYCVIVTLNGCDSEEEMYNCSHKSKTSNSNCK